MMFRYSDDHIIIVNEKSMKWQGVRAEDRQKDIDLLWPYCGKGKECPVCLVCKALGSQMAHLVVEVRPHTLIAPDGLQQLLEAYYESLFDDSKAIYLKTYGDGATLHFSGE